MKAWKPNNRFPCTAFVSHRLRLLDFGFFASEKRQSSLENMGYRQFSNAPLNEAMKIKFSIAIRSDDPDMQPLYHRLAALPVKSGRADRARILASLVEVGSAILFSNEVKGADQMIHAVRAIEMGRATPQPDGALRVSFALPDSQATRPLRARLLDLPAGPGMQDRSRLVWKALQAGVGAVYRDAPFVPAVAHSTVQARAPADQPVGAMPGTPDGFEDYLDNINVEMD